MATAFAVYCDTDKSLNFYKRDTVPTAGSTFEGKVATAVYTGIETAEYANNVPWCSDGNCYNVTNVTIVDTIAPISTAYWFSQCYSASAVNLSNLDTSNVTNMRYMFYQCFSLTSLNLSSFDTSNVTSMQSMFSRCEELASLDLSNFNTSKVTNMSYMFQDCLSLTSLNLSSFDTSSVTTMYSMFSGCTGLISLDLSTFDTSNVTTMSVMFCRCSNLSFLELSGFDTNNVTTMESMFDNCDNLTVLDLSNFDTSNLTTTRSMFSGCDKLTTIYVSEYWNMDSVTVSSYMFHYCTSLKGDIAYTSSYTDKAYATYEGGYLTYKAAPVISIVPVAYLVDKDDMIAVANAIREKAGISDEIEFPIGFADAVASIKIGDKSVGIIDRTATEYSSDELTTIAPYAFYEQDKLVTIDVPSVTAIGDYAFYGCDKLTTINAPLVTTLGRGSKATPPGYVFKGCSSLTTVNFPLLSGGAGVFNLFESCTSLTSAYLPSLGTLQGATFSGCTQLAIVDISSFSGFSTFDQFKNCTSLKAVIMRSTQIPFVPANASNHFTDSGIANGTGYFYVPYSMISKYQNDSKWSSLASQFRALEDYTVDGTVTGALDLSKI